MLLNRAGENPPLLVDGRYGPKTKAAVVAVQSRLGFRARGDIDSKTISALKSAAIAPAPEKPPEGAATVSSGAAPKAKPKGQKAKH